VTFLGVLSYSLYLFHVLVLLVLERAGLTGMKLAVPGFALSVLCAWAVYRVIERPAARLRKRFSRAFA
jgi:peptidoglycan/LPS O-acetylase OafA/YrhL